MQRKQPGTGEAVSVAGTRRRLPPELSVLGRRRRILVDWVEVDGHRLRYAIRRGQGRPMVLLNMLGASLDLMRPLAHALDGLEVIVPEMPGSGRSPALHRPRRMRFYARLLARLLDRLGYDAPVNLVGLAWGAALAQQFALDYPERVNRMVLASGSAAWPALAARSNTLKRLWLARREQRAQSGVTLLSSLYGGLVQRRPELLGRRRGGEVDGGPSARGYLNQLLGALAWTSLHRLHGLACPTLLMGGDDDPIVPLVNTRLLYWLIPKSYLHVVRGGGHLFLLMRANESAAVIKRFIKERRYDGTDDADYFLLRGLRSDGTLLPCLPAACAGS